MEAKYSCMEQRNDTMRLESCGEDLLIAMDMNGGFGSSASVYLTKAQVKQLRKDLKQHLLEDK